MKISLTLLTLALVAGACKSNRETLPVAGYYSEPFRPQVHFTPEKGWMNDPNGMVYYDGEYHLFYQYYPDSTVWGPMHWGHAVSTDLIHWQHLPVALYPDSLGYIFSGSAVMDLNNTSGFGEAGKPAMVAIFSYHDPKVLEQGGNCQSQAIAYSTDKGRTWTKYTGNPVLPNPGAPDFRDPKVSWNAAVGKWIMVLAVADHVSFYSSPDLKTWKFESDFGKDAGAHGGVWECPDLFEIPVANDTSAKKWVLIVNINPGGPQGGSGTQYFVGQFDGHSFRPEDKVTRWLDHGSDNYAGVTWSNVNDRVLYMGWMSNWAYAQKVPTHPWRSAMTSPRELSLVKSEQGYVVQSICVPEIDQIATLLASRENTDIDTSGTQLEFSGTELAVSVIDMTLIRKNADGVEIRLTNPKGQHLVLGYDAIHGLVYVDRTRAGKSDFDSTFAAVHTMGVPKLLENFQLQLVFDKSSVELYFNNGLGVMTEMFFPDVDMNSLKISTLSGKAGLRCNVSSLHPVWNQAK
jgi:fructan beta-fructosidase